MTDPRAALPAVDRLLAPALVARYGHARVVSEARAVLEAARAEIAGGGRAASREALEARLVARLAVATRPVINATGVVLHTNLGRAPWPARAIEAAAAAAGYCSVEIDLESGRRGGRAAGVEARLRALCGAEAALAVNNGAAAVLLALTAVAAGRPVLVSRGELVEIGGGFRVPDVMAASGARLVEVGTTNRTHLRDFATALTPETAAVLRVHHANFRQIGFVARPALAELAGLGPPLLVDLGSGALADDEDEPTVPAALAAGAALVCMSGDKLLGGPQAGLVVGRRDLVELLRSHPLYRALRLDKVSMAGLEGTLDAWLCGEPVPVRQMIDVPLDVLRRAVEGWRDALAETIPCSVRPVEATVGGGSLPGRVWPSYALAIRHPHPERLRAALLHGEPPVVGRVQGGELLLDARTVVPLGQGEALVAALRALPG